MSLAHSKPETSRPAAKSARAIEAEALERVTSAPFVPKADRMADLDMVSFATTETCELSCVFCHFNGPNATKKAKTIPHELVKKGVHELPSGKTVYFAATGDFFQDPNAMQHLRMTIAAGHPVHVLSHGQNMPPALLDEMVAIGVRHFRFSVDHIEPKQYAKIRRGGELQRVLDAIDHLTRRKQDTPDIDVEINCIVIGDVKERMDEFVEFWRGRIDAINFHAEYYDTLKFRNVFNVPEKRNDCHIQPYVMPSGEITPCCAMMVVAHEQDLDWLPNIRDTTLKDAYDKLCDMYEDPNSELGKICAKCQWWIMWSEPNGATTPYMTKISFDRRGSALQRLLKGIRRTLLGSSVRAPARP